MNHNHQHAPAAATLHPYTTALSRDALLAELDERHDLVEDHDDVEALWHCKSLGHGLTTQHA